MRLSRLLATEPRVIWDRTADPEVNGLCCDSRRVAPGDLFAAVPGTRRDGHQFVEEALARGASALLVQRSTPAPVPVAVTDDVRRTLGRIAAAFYGHPSADLFVVGITGTNGKTTTAYLTEKVLSAAGHRVGVVGTIDCHYAGRTFSNPVTTPEGLDLQRVLTEMRGAGVTHVVMEVSSHALDQHRVSAVEFDVGVFTNLTQDHLDYHGDLDTYWNCKRRLFTELLPGSPKAARAAAVVNTDDPRGRALAGDLSVATLTVGSGPENRIHPVTLAATVDGLTAELATPAGRLRLGTPLVGRHNLDNAMAAAACGLAAGVPPAAIARGVAALRAVPGRLERVADPSGRHIYVDYAHTPDALEHALAALRPLTPGRLICVFGCGGDRDRGKRPRMGRIAQRGSDLAVITSDNPRSEPPGAIIDEILAGLDRDAGQGAIRVEPERARAIGLALEAAAPGDTVLIAGKGHENYQILGERTIAFDDREVARRLAAAPRTAAGGDR